MTIKNIVLSGGCHTFYQTLGIIQTLEKNDIWKIENIEKIYGTSAGALLGAILCLKFDWDTLNDYFLNRPWKDVFNVDINTILSIFNTKGFFNRTQLELIFKPLLHAKDLTLNITLKELYEYSNIELYMYSFEINYFKLEEISYKTHPDLSLITALNMSSALPMMFSPVCMDDKCYIDGGTYTNYPLSFCIDQNNKLDEILGIKNVFNNECNSKCNENKTQDDEFTSKKNDIINNESSLLDFFISFFQKLILNLNIDNLTHIIKHEIYCECQTITHTFFNKVISSIETRKELLENGIECGNQYIQNISD
uniref:PNPLA domain-containing protein n=1 Tax=viral metagenome TaxID=1070528 RepID=A0A6C0EHD2_9ZZZZ